MKITSIVALGLALSLSNVAFAEKGKDKEYKKTFEQEKAKMVQRATVHSNVLNNFKICLEAAKKSEDLRECKRTKNSGMMGLRQRNK